MSKNFEEEYKSYTEQNAPDLWNRIEAALPEKEVKKENKIEAVPSEAEGKKRKKKKNLGAWVSLATAAVLMILLIPTAFFVGAGRAKDMKTENAALVKMEETAGEYCAEDTVEMNECITQEAAESVEEAPLEETQEAVTQGTSGKDELLEGTQVSGFAEPEYERKELVAAGEKIRIKDIYTDEATKATVCVIEAVGKANADVFRDDADSVNVVLIQSNEELPVIGQEYSASFYDCQPLYISSIWLLRMDLEE